MTADLPDWPALEALSVHSPWLRYLFWGTVAAGAAAITRVLGWSWREVVGWLIWGHRWPARVLKEELQADEDAFYRREHAIQAAVEERARLRLRSPWRGGSDPTI
jgi:hypothetical protein